MWEEEGLLCDNDSRQPMFGMIFGYRVSQTIGAFADLLLADHLADGPLTAAEAAARAARCGPLPGRLGATAPATGRPPDYRPGDNGDAANHDPGSC
jgi:hypothetical protein